MCAKRGTLATLVEGIKLFAKAVFVATSGRSGGFGICDGIEARFARLGIGHRVAAERAALVSLNDSLKPCVCSAVAAMRVVGALQTDGGRVVVFALVAVQALEHRVWQYVVPRLAGAAPLASTGCVQGIGSVERYKHALSSA